MTPLEITTNSSHEYFPNFTNFTLYMAEEIPPRKSNGISPGIPLGALSGIYPGFFLGISSRVLLVISSGTPLNSQEIVAGIYQRMYQFSAEFYLRLSVHFRYWSSYSQFHIKTNSLPLMPTVPIRIYSLPIGTFCQEKVENLLVVL